MSGGALTQIHCAQSYDRAVPGADAKLDEVDRQILELLREDSRRTLADIAARVNLSPAPVKRRIDRLERENVILRFTVDIDEERIGPSVEAFTEVRFTGAGDVDRVVASMTNIPEVIEVFTTAGDPDALVRIRVRDIHDLRRVVKLIRDRCGALIAVRPASVLRFRASPARSWPANVSASVVVVALRSRSQGERRR